MSTTESAINKLWGKSRGVESTIHLSLGYTLALSQHERSRVESLCQSVPGDRRERCACVCVRGCAQAAGQRPGAAEMGSTDKAVITGFICRLCSKMNRFVIHIYGEEGERMKLAEKINTYLPITVISLAPIRSIDFHLSLLRCAEAIEIPKREHNFLHTFLR